MKCCFDIKEYQGLDEGTTKQVSCVIRMNFLAVMVMVE
jgi:hypothetical protein